MRDSVEWSIRRIYQHATERAQARASARRPATRPVILDEEPREDQNG